MAAPALESLERPDAARERAAAALASAMLALLTSTAPVAAAPADRLVTRKTSGLDAKTFDALVRDGSLPARKLGRTWYARHSDVLALIGRMSEVTTPAAPSAADEELDDVDLAIARRNARTLRRAQLAAARTPSNPR